jgi:hypothetical protein
VIYVMSLAFSHVMGFVLVLTSSNRGCWLFIRIILVFVDSFYIILDLEYVI